MIVPFINIQKRAQWFSGHSDIQDQIYFLLTEGQLITSVYNVFEGSEIMIDVPSVIGLNEIKEHQLHCPDNIDELKPCDIKHEMLWGEMGVHKSVNGLHDVKETIVECGDTLSVLQRFRQWRNFNDCIYMKDNFSVKTGFINSNDHFVDLSDVFMECRVDEVLTLLNAKEALFTGCENVSDAVTNINFELHF